jgi:uncharacterized protein (TIGR03905 family)
MNTETIDFVPVGVCSKHYHIELADGRIKDIVVEGGCNGNLQGLVALLRGMTVEEAVGRLRGIDCKGKGTSCPDQIAKALARALR